MPDDRQLANRKPQRIKALRRHYNVIKIHDRAMRRVEPSCMEDAARCARGSEAMVEGPMPFVKRLTRIGDSTGIILDKQLLKLADLQPDSEVEIRVEGNAIVLTPHRYANDDEFRKAKDRVIQKNRKALTRLAK